jgi:hypothetical protein
MQLLLLPLSIGEGATDTPERHPRDTRATGGETGGETPSYLPVCEPAELIVDLAPFVGGEFG